MNLPGPDVIPHLIAWMIFPGILVTLLVKASQDIGRFTWLEPVAPIRGKWLVRLVLGLIILAVTVLTLPVVFEIRR